MHPETRRRNIAHYPCFVQVAHDAPEVEQQVLTALPTAYPALQIARVLGPGQFALSRDSLLRCGPLIA